MKSRIITIVRHAESVGNQRNVFSGSRDFDLSKAGQKRAAEVALELKNEQFGLIYTSHLKRSYNTALAIAEYHPKTPIIVDNRITERHYGRLQGFSKKLYEKNHPITYPIFHRSYSTPPPRGESIKVVELRVLSFLHDLLFTLRLSETNVCIVAHGNSIRPMRRYFENLTPREMMAIECEPGSWWQYKITDKKLNSESTYEKLERRVPSKTI